MSLINCNATYNIDVPGCTPQIQLLAPKKSVLYTLKWTFANGFIFTHKLTSTNPASLLIINKDVLDGFWNEGTGTVILQLFEGNKCDPAINTFCTQTYSQIIINFLPIESDDAYFTIPCACS